MGRLETDLEAAAQGRDHQLKASLDTLKRQIDGEIENEIAVPLQLLDYTEAEHPLLEGLRGYRRWETEREYQDGAELALSNYEKGIEQALENDWDSVAAWGFAVYIELADDIPDEQRLNKWAGRAVGFLEENYSAPDVHEGDAGRIVEALANVDLRPVDDDDIDRLVKFCWARSRYGGEQNNHHSQRKYLRRILDIKDQLERDEPLDDVHEALVASYNDEIELKRDSGWLVTAAIIERALAECREFADEDQLNDWRLEKREANRDGMRNEMSEVQAGPDDELVSLFEDACDTLVENFAQGIEQESPEVAFAGLLTIPGFVPAPRVSELDSDNQDQDQGEGVKTPLRSISEVFPKRLMKGTGDSVPEAASDLDVDEGYPGRVTVYHGMLLRVLYRILDRGLLKESHLYILLNSISGASADDRAFLTDFLRAFFERRHAEAIHLGMPRLEGLAKHQLEEAGVAITGEKRGEDLPKGLGGLLYRLEEHLDDDYVTFLKYRFTDDFGPEIRNQVAHGEIGYREAHFDISASILIETFRLSIRIDELDN